jgi:hypothetical protein
MQLLPTLQLFEARIILHMTSCQIHLICLNFKTVDRTRCGNVTFEVLSRTQINMKMTFFRDVAPPS